MVRRFRFVLGVIFAAGAGVTGVTSDGGLPILLGFIAVLIFADLLVPDSHFPLFHELPEGKRQRLRGH